MGNNITPYREESSKRIQYLIDTFCDGNQQIFANKCGIGKSSVSQYIKGINAPTNLRAIQISKVFGVSPVWIMGFDVPMTETNNTNNVDLRPDQLSLLENYELLDAEDRAEIRGMLRGMLTNDKYKKATQNGTA